jgi:hypothetical protein
MSSSHSLILVKSIPILSVRTALKNEQMQQRQAQAVRNRGFVTHFYEQKDATNTMLSR